MAFADDPENQDIRPKFNLCTCGLLHWAEHPDRQSRTLQVALVLLLSLFGVELFFSYRSHSLSLLADSGHMLADVAVLGLTLLAAHLARRPATGQATFGYGRVEILVALVNGLSLVAVSLYIALELLDRLQAPEAVVGLPMLAGAMLGLAVNSFNVCLLYRSSQSNLNYKSAFLHVAADAASSVGLVIASLAIHFWHWMWIDAIVSLVIASGTALAAIPLIKQSLEVFLEFAPRSVDPDTVKAAIAQHPGVEQVETLHIWNITPGQVMLAAHLQVRSTLSAGQRDQLVQQLQTKLKQEFGIQQITLQLVDRTSLVTTTHPLLYRSLTDYVFKKT